MIGILEGTLVVFCLMVQFNWHHAEALPEGDTCTSSFYPDTFVNLSSSAISKYSFQDYTPNEKLFSLKGYSPVVFEMLYRNYVNSDWLENGVLDISPNPSPNHTRILAKEYILDGLYKLDSNESNGPIRDAEELYKKAKDSFNRSIYGLGQVSSQNKDELLPLYKSLAENLKNHVNKDTVYNCLGGRLQDQEDCIAKFFGPSGRTEFSNIINSTGNEQKVKLWKYLLNNRRHTLAEAGPISLVINAVKDYVTNLASDFAGPIILGDLSRKLKEKIDTNSKLGLPIMLLRGYISMYNSILSISKKIVNNEQENSLSTRIFPDENNSDHFIIAPGGRFDEMYYWDTYFTLKGLLWSKYACSNIVPTILDNIVGYIEKYGYMPNGSREYYLGRSQPPLFTKMVYDYVSSFDVNNKIYDATQNKFVLKNVSPDYGVEELRHIIEASNLEDKVESYINAMNNEMEWWKKNRSVRVRSSNNKVFSSATHNETSYYRAYFYDGATGDSDCVGPRFESYYNDREVVEDIPLSEHPEVYRSLRAGAESGWDFSTRWVALSKREEIRDEITSMENNYSETHGGKPFNAFSPEITNKILQKISVPRILPVDLNSIMAFNAKALFKLMSAIDEKKHASDIKKYRKMYYNLRAFIFQETYAEGAYNTDIFLPEGADKGGWVDITNAELGGWSAASAFPFWLELHKILSPEDKEIAKLKKSVKGNHSCLKKLNALLDPSKIYKEIIAFTSAEKDEKKMEKLLESLRNISMAGVIPTNYMTPLQWDSPAIWAPLVYVYVEATRKISESLSTKDELDDFCETNDICSQKQYIEEIVQQLKDVSLNTALNFIKLVLSRTVPVESANPTVENKNFPELECIQGKIHNKLEVGSTCVYEKYYPKEYQDIVLGEYPMQLGFGWTAGTVLDFIQKLIVNLASSSHQTGSDRTIQLDLDNIETYNNIHINQFKNFVQEYAEDFGSSMLPSKAVKT